MATTGWMPLRTRALATFSRLTSTPVDALTPAQIKKVRAATVPLTAPFTWVTGPVGDNVVSHTRYVTVRDGHRVRIRVHRPLDATEPLPLLMHFHGGGFVIGNLQTYEPLTTRIAAQARVVVVTVNYRKAPEYVAPLAAYDCIDVTEWAVANAADLGARSDSFGVTGDSAGGNLAAVVAQTMRDRGESGLRHQALVYPAPDLTEHELEHLDRVFPILTPQMMLAFRAMYLGSEDIDGADWLLSPARGRLEGLPPALLQTAEHDPLRDDGIAYGLALRDAGVEVRMTTYRGAPHGFQTFTGLTSAGSPALEELVGEVRHHLHAPVMSEAAR